MKVLFQSHAFYPSTGGIESSAKLLIEAMRTQGIELRIHTSVDLAGAPELEHLSIKRKPTPQEIRTDARWADLIYQHNPSLQLAWPSLFLGVPTVVSIHTWVQRMDGTLNWVDRIKRLWLSAQTVISNSQATADHLSCDSTVIENTYDASVFGQHTRASERSGLAFVGRLVSDKGCDTVIQALAELKAKGNPLPLTIIGDGPERNALEAMVDTLKLRDQVSFTGNLTPSQIAQELPKYRYLAVPSRWAEPFGIVALEGIASGCIPIGTNRGGLVDAIGRCGPLFPADNAQVMAQMIEQLESDTKLRDSYLGQHAQHLEAHSPQSIGTAYLAVFRKALHKSDGNEQPKV